MIINIYGRLVTLWGCGCFNSSYFNGTNGCHTHTTINWLPTLDRSRRPISCLLGTFVLFLMGHIIILSIPLFLARVIWLLIIWTWLSRNIEFWELYLLIIHGLSELRNTGIPLSFTIIAASPLLGMSSWLGNLLTYIHTVGRFKDLVLITFT